MRTCHFTTQKRSSGDRMPSRPRPRRLMEKSRMLPTSKWKDHERVPFGAKTGHERAGKKRELAETRVSRVKSSCHVNTNFRMGSFIWCLIKTNSISGYFDEFSVSANLIVFPAETFSG